MLIGLLITGITLVGHVSWFDLMDRVGYGAFAFAGWIRQKVEDLVDRKKGARVRKEREVAVKEFRTTLSERKPPRIEPKIDAPVQSERKQQEQKSRILKS